jgi:hypothetical protein
MSLYIAKTVRVINCGPINRIIGEQKNTSSTYILGRKGVMRTKTIAFSGYKKTFPWSNPKEKWVLQTDGEECGNFNGLPSLSDKSVIDAVVRIQTSIPNDSIVTQVSGIIVKDGVILTTSDCTLGLTPDLASRIQVYRKLTQPGGEELIYEDQRKVIEYKTVLSAKGDDYGLVILRVAKYGDNDFGRTQGSWIPGISPISIDAWIGLHPEGVLHSIYGDSNVADSLTMASSIKIDESDSIGSSNIMIPYKAKLTTLPEAPQPSGFVNTQGTLEMYVSGAPVFADQTGSADRLAVDNNMAKWALIGMTRSSTYTDQDGNCLVQGLVFRTYEGKDFDISESIPASWI